jgi:thioesterase domain-containing protein
MKHGNIISTDKLGGLIYRASRRLDDKAEEKGDWSQWNPSPEDLQCRIEDKAAKITAACDAGDMGELRDHIADLFNYTCKAYDLATDND